MDERIFKKYIVWVDYGSQGWNATDFDTWEEAVKYWKQEADKSILTEYIPLSITDGRKPKNVNNFRNE
jgi:hypothetical protein